MRFLTPGGKQAQIAYGNGNIQDLHLEALVKAMSAGFPDECSEYYRDVVLCEEDRGLVRWQPACTRGNILAEQSTANIRVTVSHK